MIQPLLRGLALAGVQQPARFGLQRPGDALEQADGQIAAALLQRGEIPFRDPRGGGEGLAGHAPSGPQAADLGAEAFEQAGGFIGGELSYCHGVSNEILSERPCLPPARMYIMMHIPARAMQADAVNT